MLRRVTVTLSLLLLAVPNAMASSTGDFVDKVIYAESSGNPQARPCDPETGELLSSAYGAGQFIEATWLEMVRRYRPDLVARTDDEILALRSDFALSREMTIKFTEENRTYLIRKGLDATHAALYLAHFAGARGAATLLKTHRDTPVEDILSPEAVAANAFLGGHTVATLYAWAKTKMNAEVDPAPPHTAVADSAEVTPHAGPGCGPDRPATRVADMTREEPNSRVPGSRQKEVQFIRGGLVEVTAAN